MDSVPMTFVFFRFCAYHTCHFEGYVSVTLTFLWILCLSHRILRVPFQSHLLVYKFSVCHT